MSIFDDLSKDSFLSKRATNKQTSGLNKRADTEIASDMAVRNKADTEVASDMAARNKADTEVASDMAAKNEADDEMTSDLIARNNANTEFSSDIAFKGANKSDAEAASDMSGTNQYGTQTYSHAGVAFNKVSDGEAKINYAGLLSRDGAQEVVGVYGYGSNQSWENVSSVPLAKDYSGGFTATIPIVNGKNINFAFKDVAENWDNNAGLNYTFVN